MLTSLRNQIIKISLLAFCVYFLVAHLAQPINLTDQDIGRHIKNGELILSGHWDIFYKNYYSYTFPDFSFINHHWFFGIISYAIFHVSGFDGLEVFYILLLTGAFLLSFDSARRYSNFSLAIFASAASLLMVTSRAEIRPEGVSAFMVAFDFWLLQRYLEGSIKQPWLWAIPALQVMWVNTHIFFFLGPCLVALFLWEAAVAKASSEKILFLKRILLISILVCIINPSGIGGMLTPLNGFKKFGYDLAENQPVFFMIKRFGDNIVYKYFVVAAVIMFIGIGLILCQRQKKHIPKLVLALFVTLAGIRAVRLIMPFGFLFIPLMAYCYAPYVKKAWVEFILFFMALAGIIWCLVAYPARPQIGLLSHNEASAAFYQQSGLHGPIFSNYDIGGYLIYFLGPAEKVFVDNRQEAFPADFFRKTYIPMQEDPKRWKAESDKWGFNVIYFFRRDLTPWGQDFLVARIDDPNWAPIFVDEYTIIFARRGSVNQGVIDRYELPRFLFGVTKVQ